MMYRLMLLVVFYNVFCTIVEVETNGYRIPLVRRKSPLQMLIKDPDYTRKLNIQKNSPTNENITLFKYLDSEYYANILVGKPGQKFSVIFDTTWGDMWIPSKLCSKKIYPICDTKNLYDPDISSSHKSIDPAPFHVDGLVGNLTCDTVVMGHLNVSDLTFAAISEIPSVSQYQMMHADGLIGLGYNTLARTTNLTFFYKLLEDKKILKPIFSVYMNRDMTTSKGGIIFLGGIEPRHIKGEITYVPVSMKKYWQIEMNQFSVNVNKTNSKTFCGNHGCQVILDTSSNAIGVPNEYVLAINNLISATKYLYNRYEVPCSKVNKLPKITLNIGSRDFYISGRNYIQKMENENGTVCITAFCDSQLPDGLWSLGGGFLSSVYTTFDLENNRVGIANLK